MAARYSVTIVGAGPTGLMMANLLGKAGVSTLVVEANAATVGEPRAVSIDDESLRVIDEIGLLDVVRSETVAGYGSEYLGPDRRMFLKVKPLEQPYGHPRRNAFRQPVLEAQLRDGLARFANVRTHFECRAEAFREVEGGVRVSLSHADGEAEEIESDYLVGCDGASSTIRRLLGATLKGKSHPDRWLIIDLENASSASHETVVYCDPRRPGIMLPGPRSTRRYEFKLHRHESDAEILSDAHIASLLEAHDPAPGSRIVRQTIYDFHARIADRWGSGRVWLAGDAAHLMPPFAGQGMNAGIRDAANLSWKLAAVIEGRLGPRIIATFETERRAHVEAMIRLALRMGSIFAPRSALHGWLTRGLFGLLGRWPAASSYFAEMKYKPPPRFDEGFLLGHQLSRRGIVGRMLPQPEIKTDRDGVKIDHLLGGGFALLGIDVDPAMVETLSLGAMWDRLLETRLTLTTAAAPAFADLSGQLLVVRPDRYVLASFAPDTVEDIAAFLTGLVEQTWTPPREQLTPSESRLLLQQLTH